MGNLGQSEKLKEIALNSHRYLEEIIIQKDEIIQSQSVELAKLEKINILIKDIEYQCLQARSHPALLGITVAINTIKKLL